MCIFLSLYSNPSHLIGPKLFGWPLIRKVFIYWNSAQEMYLIHLNMTPFWITHLH